jgi:hypothetical protein
LNRVAWISRVVAAICLMTQIPVQALAVQHGAEKHAAHKKHHRHKAKRRPDVMYRWSDEQLMLGGVNPASIGKESDAGGKQNEQAAVTERTRSSGD